jgi:hypothetical protein
MPKIKQTLRSISFYNGQNTTILAHFSAFQILAHFFLSDFSWLQVLHNS